METWTIENDIRENLIKAYQQYDFNRYLDEDVSEVSIEIQTLEKLVDKICVMKNITKIQFLLEDDQWNKYSNYY